MEASNMEETAEGIQIESMQTTGASNTEKNIITDESPAKKGSIFCFKKKRKAGEKVTEKADDCESRSLNPANQDCNPGDSEAEVSNSLWTSGGAWMAFKRLVTLRRQSKSSLKKHTQSGSSIELEMHVEDLATLRCPKERTSLKMPCLRFPRGRKKPSRSKTTEELGEKADETTSILNKKSASEPESMGLEQSPSRVLEEREGDSKVVQNVDNVVVPPRENSFAIETRPGPDCYTDSVVHSEIIHSEKVLETEQEKQIFQLHQGSLYGEPEEVETKKFDFKVDMGPLLPQVCPEAEQRVLEGEAKKIQATEAELGPLGSLADTVEDRASGKESSAVEVMLHCVPTTLEDTISVCSEEEAKSEENKPAMPGAGIVITITEAEDFQEEEEPTQVCEPFSFSHASKQKGKRKGNKNADSSSKVPSPLGTNDQDHRTSEQYEVLLIETAASLVKAAIQSSVEQVLNEMALEQNKQNSFL